MRARGILGHLLRESRVHRVARAPAARRLVGVVLAGALAACSLGTDPAGPRITSTELTEPAPLVRRLQLTLEQPQPVAVEYWADDGPRLRVDAPAAQEPTLLLTRLRPGRHYQYRVLSTATTGAFTTDPLPDDLARVAPSATGTPAVPLVLLHLYEPTGFKGYAIVDATGEVVWYWRTEDFPFGAARRADGNFVFMDKGRGLVEVTPDGRVVHELAQDLAERELHHNVIATPRNTLLFIAFDPRVVDGTRVLGEAIWEWDPENGTATKRWSAWDHFSFATDRGPRGGTEWMHANSLAIGLRGNVLLSVHYWNQVVSITPDWQDIEWRLGGVNATIPVPADARFSGQHTAHEVAPGQFLMFDNRRDVGPSSRGLLLDTAGGTVRALWEWTPTPPNLSTAVGSARRLENGGVLLGFGMSAGRDGSTGPVEVYEVTESGTVAWHLVVARTSVMYRAEPLTSVGAERVVP